MEKEVWVKVISEDNYQIHKGHIRKGVVFKATLTQDELFYDKVGTNGADWAYYEEVEVLSELEAFTYEVMEKQKKCRKKKKKSG